MSVISCVWLFGNKDYIQVSKCSVNGGCFCNFVSYTAPAFCYGLMCFFMSQDNVSPQRDTFSSWYRRPVQMPVFKDTDVFDPELDPTDETSEIAEVEVPQAPERSFDRLAFCKHFKEEEQKVSTPHEGS